MRTTPEPKLEDRETVLSRRAASSQNRRRLPILLRQKKFRNSIGHEAPAEISAASATNSHQQLEFVQLCRKTSKRSFWSHRTIDAFYCGPIASQFPSRIERSQNRY